MPLLLCPAFESLYEVSVHMLALPGHLPVSSFQGPLRVCPLLSRMMWESWLQVSPSSMPTLTNAACSGFPCPEKRASSMLTAWPSGMHPCQAQLWDAAALSVPCHLSPSFLFPSEEDPTLPPRIALQHYKSLLPHRPNANLPLENGRGRDWVGG